MKILLFVVVLVVRSQAFLGNTRLLPCIARQVQCTSVSWDAYCCTQTIQEMGRSFQNMGNFRFGSGLRNAIPPPRAYNPPSFDDIFGGKTEGGGGRSNDGGTIIEEDRVRDIEKEEKEEENTVRLRLPGGLEQEQSKTLDTRQRFLAKLKLIKMWNERKKMLQAKHSSLKNTKLTRRTTTTAQPTTTKSTTITTTTTTTLRTTTSASQPSIKRMLSMSKMKQHYFNLKQESSKYASRKGYKNKLDKMNENLYVSNVAYGAPIKDKYQTHFSLANENSSGWHEPQQTTTTTERGVVTTVSGLKYLDHSQNTRMAPYDDVDYEPTNKHKSSEGSSTRDSLLVTAGHIIDMTPMRLQDKAERRSSVMKKYVDGDVSENIVEVEERSEVEKKEKSQFSQELCEALRVPCRFVTEHPCCLLPQSIDLVARARALDGGADLRWRYLQSGQKRDRGAQGRMISGFPGQKNSGTRTSFNSNPRLSKKINYNHATSKDVVEVPVYHTDGGPQQTSTILSQCWRLTYLNCRKNKSHPCCSLASPRRAGYGSPVLSSNILDKWLIRA